MTFHGAVHCLKTSTTVEALNKKTKAKKVVVLNCIIVLHQRHLANVAVLFILLNYLLSSNFLEKSSNFGQLLKNFGATFKKI